MPKQVRASTSRREGPRPPRRSEPPRLCFWGPWARGLGRRSGTLPEATPGRAAPPSRGEGGAGGPEAAAPGLTCAPPGPGPVPGPGRGAGPAAFEERARRGRRAQTRGRGCLRGRDPARPGDRLPSARRPCPGARRRRGLHPPARPPPLAGRPGPPPPPPRRPARPPRLASRGRGRRGPGAPRPSGPGGGDGRPGRASPPPAAHRRPSSPAPAPARRGAREGGARGAGRPPRRPLPGPTGGGGRRRPRSGSRARWLGIMGMARPSSGGGARPGRTPARRARAHLPAALRRSRGRRAPPPRPATRGPPSARGRRQPPGTRRPSPDSHGDPRNAPAAVGELLVGVMPDSHPTPCRRRGPWGPVDRPVPGAGSAPLAEGRAERE
ncbi:basic proline-rich protein-like [Equus przewalskii]|uniref:Basic proline-rich protein-like n=1 Tax=Equus przewalskii TaxID=9798 RepID=A0ABM4MGU3_EQUPR